MSFTVTSMSFFKNLTTLASIKLRSLNSEHCKDSDTTSYKIVDGVMTSLERINESVQTAVTKAEAKQVKQVKQVPFIPLSMVSTYQELDLNCTQTMAWVSHNRIQITKIYTCPETHELCLQDGESYDMDDPDEWYPRKAFDELVAIIKKHNER